MRWPIKATLEDMDYAYNNNGEGAAWASFRVVAWITTLVVGLVAFVAAVGWLSILVIFAISVFGTLWYGIYRSVK